MRPVIIKLGTIDCDMVETTPVVFKDRLYRFEYVRKDYWQNQTGDSYFRFVDVQTGFSSESFAAGFHLGSAYVENDTVYVTAVDIWDGEYIDIFMSTDLSQWEQWNVIHLPDYGIFNTSLCRTDSDYVLMYEIGKPEKEAGKRFTARFIRSKDLRHWKLTRPECNYAKDRYTAPHCLRFLDGYFYNFYLEAFNGYETRVVRSKDLMNWEVSPLNPVLRASVDDQQIANASLPDSLQKRIANAKNINNSDIDFCEYNGKLYITYSWGNQRGIEFLAQALYQGSEQDFIRGWFPQD
jgi:alpha-L-fucosidase